MGETLRYIASGFRNAFTTFPLESDMIYRAGDLSRRIYKKRIKELEKRYGEEQIKEKKSKKQSSVGNK